MSVKPILNAHDHPDSEKAAFDFVVLFRMALAPLFNADIENLPMHQSVAITAGGLFAGMTVGHMLAVGVLDEAAGDREQAKLVAMQAFDAGVEMGLSEARDAILRQAMAGGGNV